METTEVLFTPAEYETPGAVGQAGQVCVVFDVLRATSTMVTALAHGAAGILPAASIPEALGLRARRPDALLAGERGGRRIGPDLAEGREFDLGNSPREFTAPGIRGRTIVMTTTNGTRALRACAGTRAALVCSFLNLRATAARLLEWSPERLTLVCSGTGEQAAYEDALCAGALADLLWSRRDADGIADSTLLARRLHQAEGPGLAGALARGCNGRRLLGIPELQADVAFCAEVDRYPLVAGLDPAGMVAVQGS